MAGKPDDYRGASERNGYAPGSTMTSFYPLSMPDLQIRPPWAETRWRLTKATGCYKLTY